MRFLLAVSAALVLCSCGSPGSSVQRTPPDPTADAAYVETVGQLAALSREAASSLESGKRDAASAAITQAQPLISRVLSVSRPTLPAMEAASLIDDVYGRMLMDNRHYGAARLLFQKNVARWRNWQPQTEETARLRKLAESRIDECDKRMTQ